MHANFIKDKMAKRKKLCFDREDEDQEENYLGGVKGNQTCDAEDLNNHEKDHQSHEKHLGRTHLMNPYLMPLNLHKAYIKRSSPPSITIYW